MADPYIDREFSCVYCWHDRSYHADGPCSGDFKTTAGTQKCECPHFYSRKLAIELIDAHRAVATEPAASIS